MSFPVLLYFCLAMLAGCNPRSDSSTLQVQVKYQQQKISCDAPLKAATEEWQIDALKWYLSDVQMQYQQQWQPLALATNASQNEGVVLLEADGCNKQSMQVLLNQALDWQDVTALRFQLGLPFALNHANPLIQPAPINRPDMFWSWQTGHKFMRADLSRQGSAWSFHLGSIGCTADSAMRAPMQSCKQPNLLTYEVPTHASAGQLVFHLDQLLLGLDLAADQGCRFHGNQESSCRQLLNNLNEKRIFTWQPD